MVSLDAEAILLCELGGTGEEVSEQIYKVRQILSESGATEVRTAKDEAERLTFWKGRKAAFPAVGRLAPDYYCMDGTIPRKQLPEADGAGCCGAVSHHLAAPGESFAYMRSNIDAWWPHIEAGAEAILITASGCGALEKEYGHLLKDDPQYARKAAKVAEMAMDVSEVLRDEPLPKERLQVVQKPVAFHSSCTLQHGQQLDGVVEDILRKAGFKLTPVADAHLCCGSAGTYSILQPELSQQLLDNKLAALEAENPEIIATANVGCQLHLASRAHKPVKHWIELIDEALN